MDGQVGVLMRRTHSDIPPLLLSVATAAALACPLRFKLLALTQDPPDQRLPPTTLHRRHGVPLDAQLSLMPRRVGLHDPLPGLGCEQFRDRSEPVGGALMIGGGAEILQ